MSELSLNLVALSVFLMTMSALLGPLVHLSPAVPAIATATVLGVATLDTFSWQGNGATLFLDWLARFSPQYRARVVHHEAGHFLVAHHLGMSVTGYALSAWDAFKQGQFKQEGQFKQQGQFQPQFQPQEQFNQQGLGQAGIQVNPQSLESHSDLAARSLQRDLQLDHYCTVWMAGSAAENLVYQTVQGGQDDYQKLRMALSQAAFSEPQRQQKENLAKLRAKTILQEHWPAYEALVVAMAQRASVAECIQVLEQHLPNLRPALEEHAKVIK